MKSSTVKKNMKLFPKLSKLALAITSLLVISTTHADTKGKMIGDLEIYQVPDAGAATLMMMLDTSGSMGTSSLVDFYRKSDYILPNGVYRYDSRTYRYRPCAYMSNTDGTGIYYRSPVVQRSITIPHILEDGSKNGTEYTFNVIGCLGDGGTISYDEANGEINTQILDRISRLKFALIHLLADERKLGNQHKIGIGNYSYKGKGRKGKIGIPSKELSTQHRKSLINYVIGLQARGGTPSAHAYAEAGAYMMGTTTSTTNNSASYSGYNVAGTDTQNVAGGKYISPITASECGGQGIYFLTDGFPNNSNYYIASNLMSKSLNQTNTIFTRRNNGRYSDCNGDLNLGSWGQNESWGCMGEYSKKLNTASNPSGYAIKTAAAGFGSVFAGNGGLPTTQKNVDGELKTVVDCESLSSMHAQNLCKLSEEGWKHGEGGFIATNSSSELATSITDFVSSLQGNIGSVASGIIVVPEDPYSASSQQAVAYYPSVDAKVLENNVVWPGNMKKYSLSEGTLYGKESGRKLFLDISGALNSKVEDWWSDKNYIEANNQVTNGGFYAHLIDPSKETNIASTRTVYVEDWLSPTDDTPALRKFGVDDNGKVILSKANNFSDISTLASGATFHDTTTYTEDNMKALLSFLGFINLEGSDLIDATKARTVANMKLSKIKNADQSVRVLGASMHSAPELVSYFAKLDPDGRVTDDRNEYVWFGSMDGAMHLVNVKNYTAGGNGGKETFAFIPRQIIKNQPEALIYNNTHAKIGIPKMGMDAPWLVDADYEYKTNTSGGTVKSKTMYAYGGMRMGGDAFYGVDLTDKTAPRILFTLSPNPSPLTPSVKSEFNRMGQIWSKPTKARIKTKKNEVTDVIIFGGGYDTCYENETFQIGLSSAKKKNLTDINNNSCDKDSAQGNAIYIVKAETGKLIWSASNTGTKSSTYTKHKDIKNSVVAGITVLDRDNDGYMDHLYFADLGGQVFRADFTNAGFIPPGKTDADATTKFENVRIQKILKNKNENGNAKYAYRFYERPVISFYRNPNTNRLFAMVNIISGDRSSPLSKMRNDNSHADRLYGIMDTDVTKNKADFFGKNASGQESFQAKIANLKDHDFYALPIKSNGTLETKDKNLIVNGLKAGTKKGWYYPLTRFDGYNNVKYTKGVGKSDVIGGFLHTTVYNPDMSYSKATSCTARVEGGSERQLYCLPYGVCMDEKSKNGTGGFVPAGQGIQELTLGPRDENNTTQKLLIGTRTLKEQAKDRIDSNEGGKNLGGGTSYLYEEQKNNAEKEGGDASAPAYVFNERYVLKPTRWYESNE